MRCFFVAGTEPVLWLRRQKKKAAHAAEEGSVSGVATVALRSKVQGPMSKVIFYPTLDVGLWTLDLGLLSYHGPLTGNTPS